MSVGVVLSKEDLEAIATLYKVRWSANIRNWKERGVDGCLWVVICPDSAGSWVTRTGTSLSKTIMNLLKELEINA